MKKLLFTLLSAVTLFSSCSSDNDPISQDTNFDPVKYTVNLNVKSAGFEVDKAPLKSTGWSRYSFLQIIVYKESGEVYSDSIIEPADLSALIAESNTPQISLSLPKGNYYLSLLKKSTYGSSLYKIEDLKILPNNYETDYYDRKINDYYNSEYTNENTYYHTSALKVTEGSNNKDIVLDPMWSYLKYGNIKYAPKFKYPVGTDTDIPQITNKYYGFGIKSKLAKTLYPFSYKESTWILLSNNIETVDITSKAEDNQLYLEICYAKKVYYENGYYITNIQKIKLPSNIENGMNYTISGTIPDIDNIDSELLNVSTEPFKDSNISFQ